jgi:hypothetical protein
LITGFNTDIEYDGVVYHVQTEDKGLDSPLILSLVYAGGAILASKRSRYEDLIAAGFDEEVLSERLKRQHRLICAAINAGRIEDLKRMGGKAGAEAEAEVEPVAATEATPDEEGKSTDFDLVRDGDTIEIIRTADELYSEGSYSRDTAPLVMPENVESVEAQAAKESPFTVYDPRRKSIQSGQVLTESGLSLAILDDAEFHAGQAYSIHIMLEDTAGLKPKPLAGVALSVKILGTGFRPQIYSINTERSGVAIVAATMPSFTSGRAAVLVRAVVNDETIELRRVIHPATAA